MPYKGAGVAISVMLWHSFMIGNTFKHLNYGGRNFSVCGLIRMGSRAWVRGSYRLGIDQTENFLFDLASLFTS